MHVGDWGQNHVQGPRLWAGSHEVPIPNMEAKSQLLSLTKALKYGLYSLKADLDYLMQKHLSGLVLRVGSSFLLEPTLNTSPKSHLQKSLPCRHPCHTWDLGLGNHVKW